MDVNFTDALVLEIPPEVVMATPFAVRILVGGTLPLTYGQDFGARFDADIVSAVAVDSAGTGFSGYMEKPPEEGATLFVTLPGQDEIDTGLVYHAPDPSIA